MLAQMRKGVLLGLLTAALFCIWITIVRLTSGEQAFTRLGITYAGTMVTYVLMGMASGAIIGALMRFTDSRVGAYLVGFLGGTPIILGIMLQQAGLPRHWAPEDFTLAPVLSLVATLAIGSEIQRRRSSKIE